MPETHPTTLEISDIRSDVDAGTDITLAVRVSCAAGCDLRGCHVTITAPDGVVREIPLATWANQTNATGDVVLTAPREVGDYAWSVRFAAQETESLVHEQSALSIPFRTIPHVTSMAVWDAPSPVVIGRMFNAKVGVQCSASCKLTGASIEVLNEEGERVSEGRLGDTTWSGTSSLYWVEVSLPAPAVAGTALRFVRFVTGESPLPHGDSSASFSVRADKPPEHKVRITVTDSKTSIPIEGVEVRLGLYHAITDDHGMIDVELPTASYDLSIRADGYAARPRTVDVSGDLRLQVDAVTAPTQAEMVEKQRKFEDYTWG